MKSKSMFSFMIVSAFLSHVTVAQTTNLVVNGSFEDSIWPGNYEFQVLSAGDSGITGWTVKPVGVDYIGYHWAHSDGIRSIDLNAYEAGGIMQDIATIPGATYLVEFDLAGNPAGKPAQYSSPSVKTLNVSAAGESQAFSFDVTYTSRSAMGWAGKQWSFTAVASTTTLSFDSTCFGPEWEGTAGWFGPALDNVRVFLTASVNQPPVANAGSDQTIEAASPDGASVTLDGSGSTDPDSSIGTNDDIKFFDWYEGATSLGSGEIINYTFPLGSHTVTLVVTDFSEETDSDEVNIIVEDTTPPVITLNGDATITLECGIDDYQEFGATASDICDPTVLVEIGGDTVDTSICGTYILTYNATDASGNSAIQATRTVTVEDSLPPEIIAAIVEPQVVEVGQPVNFDAVVGDECDTIVEWDFGDGDASPDIEATHVYTDSDIYMATFSVTDASGYSAIEEFFVVAYNLSGGFVTGGGWIYADAGAFSWDENAQGKANFGFVSKYKKGTSIPSGNTEFEFKAGNLNFHSSSYEWLVVTGSDYARFKGIGTINGSGEYIFMVWAGDNNPDTFRIRIWEEDELGVETDVYDNGFDQTIGGGSIKIHTN